MMHVSYYLRGLTMLGAVALALATLFLAIGLLGYHIDSRRNTFAWRWAPALRMPPAEDLGRVIYKPYTVLLFCQDSRHDCHIV